MNSNQRQCIETSTPEQFKAWLASYAPTSNVGVHKTYDRKVACVYALHRLDRRQ